MRRHRRAPCAHAGSALGGAPVGVARNCAMLVTLCCALGFAAALTGVSADAGGACTFQPNCDYGHGTRLRAPASSKEECCTLCQAHAGCAAGVLTGGECFFKTAYDVEGGCVKSSRSQFGCLTPFVKQLETMEKKYRALLNATCAAVVARAPALPSAGVASFMAAFKNHSVAHIDPTQVLAAARMRSRCSRSPP